MAIGIIVWKIHICSGCVGVSGKRRHPNGNLIQCFANLLYYTNGHQLCIIIVWILIIMMCLDIVHILYVNMLNIQHYLSLFFSVPFSSPPIFILLASHANRSTSSKIHCESFHIVPVRVHLYSTRRTISGNCVIRSRLLEAAYRFCLLCVRVHRLNSLDFIDWKMSSRIWSTICNTQQHCCVYDVILSPAFVIWSCI